MPRSHRDRWSRVVSWENLVEAYGRCRRRKRHRPTAVAFDFDWESQLLALARELRDGSYRPGPYRHFRITDPKPRLISAAPFRDRVVHHALVQVLEPIFDRGFIHDSYACRRGKGTHRAIARACGCGCIRTRPRFCPRQRARRFWDGGSPPARCGFRSGRSGGFPGG